MTRFDAYRDGEKAIFEYLRAHARSQPDRPALVFYGHTISYRELDRLSDRFARYLQDRGIGFGDRVVLMLGNCPQFHIAFFGVQKIGAVVSPCSPLFQSEEIVHQTSDLGAKAFVAHDHLMPMLESLRGRLGVEHFVSVAVADMLPDRPTIRIPDELAQRTDIPGFAVDMKLAVDHDLEMLPLQRQPSVHDLGMMIYTSGSTGRPKGAMLTHGNVVFKSAVGVDTIDIQQSDVILAIAPIYHVAGMTFGVHDSTYAGATVVLFYKMDAVGAAQAIERHAVTWWYAMAPMLQAVVNEPECARHDMSTLRMVGGTSFGIKLTEGLAESFRTLAPNATVFELGYGLSETVSSDTMMPPQAIRWGTQGKPARHIRMRIVDPQGRDVEIGQLGEVVLKSQGNFLGYWNRPEATAEVLRDGWVHTGDIGSVDVDGYFTIQGRIKEMIKVSGYSVFPEEVEAILRLHAGVRQVAITGKPHETKGEVVWAFVVIEPGFDPRSFPHDLIEWSRDKMAYYKVPKEVRILENLPATSTGKLLRRLLKDIE